MLESAEVVRGAEGNGKTYLRMTIGAAGIL